MSRDLKTKKKKEKFTSDIFELINYFEFKPWINLPYAYFRCDSSELERGCWSTRFFGLNLRTDEVKCIDPETLEECNMPYCCSILSDLRDLREFRELERAEKKNEDLL